GSWSNFVVVVVATVPALVGPAGCFKFAVGGPVITTGNCARTPGSCMAIPSITGAMLRGRYATLTQSIPSPGRPSSITAFHCRNRAAGPPICVPGAVYGPNHRDHSFPGSSVFPLRTKNSSRGCLFSFATFAGSFAAGGPHHSMRPHCENSFASNACDSNVPSGSYSGPSEKTFPGFAVHR